MSSDASKRAVLVATGSLPARLRIPYGGGDGAEGCDYSNIGAGSVASAISRFREYISHVFYNVFS